MKYIMMSIVVVLIGLGVAVRFIEVANGNYVFGFDQGMDFLAARRIAVDHKLTLIGSEAGAGFAGLPGIFHGPGYHYLLAGILFVSSGNPYGAIVFLAILGVVSLWFLYRLTKSVFGRESAIAVLVLAALSPPLTAMARMIWAPNFSAVLAIPYLCSLWWARKKTLMSAFVTSFLAASLYHFELPMAVPAVVATLVYFWFILRIRSVRLWAAALLGIVAGFSPMLLFESRHGWGMLRGLTSYSTKITENASVTPFRPIQELFGDANAILVTINESFLWYPTRIRDVFPWILLPALLYFVWHEKQKHVREFMSALLLLIVSHLFVFYPYRGPVYSHYLSLLYFVYPIVTAYATVKALRVRLGRFVIYSFGLLFAIGVIQNIPITIMKDYRDYGGTAKIRGKIDAIDYVYKQAGGNEFNLRVFTPPVYTYPYDYILKWYAAKQYGYLPGVELGETVYLLMEPDPEKPWSYNGWLETVIQRGTVVSTTTLPSGFIIQKRIFKQ